MDAHTLADLIEHGAASGRAYHEFLRRDSMSAGIYRLPAGGTDAQSPHREDELYWVLEGRATLRVEDEDRPVEAGVSVFVPACVPHRFHSISADLVVLVVFAPPESDT